MGQAPPLEGKYLLHYITHKNMAMINEIIHRVCPMTVLLNVSAISIGMSEVEQTLKMISYLVAIVWTILKIRYEIRLYRNKIKDKR